MNLRSIGSELISIILALTSALVIWVMATYEENPPRTELFPQGIPIETVGKDEQRIIMGEVADEVQITIKAPKSSWERLTPSSFRAFVDLEGLSPGPHEVDVQVECSDSSVDILKKEPEKVTVRLEELKEKELPVQVNVLGNPAQGYTDRIPVVTPSEVKVKGPGSIVDRVAAVVAEANLRGAKDTLDREVKILPLDEEGESIGGVELNPSRVQVWVPIEQRAGYKDVAVRVLWEGQVALSYRLSNISVEPSIVTVTGNPSTIEEIPGYLQTVPVDVQGATANMVERVPLTMPEGITVLGQQSVLVKIEIAAIESSLTMHRELTIHGLGQGLKATLSPEVVDVILSGPLPMLQNLEPEQVQVVLDLFGLEEGTRKLIPTVIVPEELKVESIVPETIEAKISAAPTLVPTVTPKATQTPTPTPVPPTPTPAPPPPCPNPGARLTYPTVDAVLKGVVQVRGSADIEDFHYYKLEFRSEGSPEWSLLQRFEEPVAEGVLAAWDTSSLLPGTYWLRLVVVDATGNYPEPCQVRVIIK